VRKALLLVAFIFLFQLESAPAEAQSCPLGATEYSGQLVLPPGTYSGGTEGYWWDVPYEGVTLTLPLNAWYTVNRVRFYSRPVAQFNRRVYVDLIINNQTVGSEFISGSTVVSMFELYNGSPILTNELQFFAYPQSSSAPDPLIYITKVEIRYCTNVVANFTATPDSGPAPLQVDFQNRSTGNITSYAWDFGDSSSSSAPNPTHTYTQPGTYTVTLTVTGPQGSSSTNGTITVLDDPLPGGNLYRPLADADIHPNGIFDRALMLADAPPIIAAALEGISVPTENLVVAMSRASGANVHAVTDGTVTLVERVITGDCFGLRKNLNQCSFTYWFDVDEVPGFTDYAVNTSGLYRVRVSFDTGRYIEYIVNDAPLYVRVGQEIRAGCVIGKTAGTSFANPFGVGELAFGVEYSPPAFAFNEGVAFVSLRTLPPLDEVQPLVSQLVVSIDAATACNVDPQFADCLGDPLFDSPNTWTTFGGVQWGSGVTLQRNATIRYEGLPLSPSLSYRFTVTIERLGPTGAMRLTLGHETVNFTLPYPIEDYEIPAGQYDPDQGLLYSVSITNTGQHPIRIVSNCLTDNLSSGTPDTCYFRNYSFDRGTADWNPTGTIYDGIAVGEIIMTDGATISQNARLYPAPNGSYQYRVTIRAALIGAVDGATDTTSYVLFEWRYPSSASWQGFLDPASTVTGYPFAGFFGNRVNNLNFFPNGEVLFEALVDVDDVTTDLFVIRLTIDDSGQQNFTGGVAVREVCINDPFAHWPAGGGGRLPFAQDCSIVTPPDGNEIGDWIFYLWRSLSRFFSCDLMRLLNQMFNLMYRAYEVMVWQALYWQSSAIMTSEWVKSDLTPWLGGHFANIAQGRTTTVIQTGGGCDNLFCLLEALVSGIFSPLVDTFASIVHALIFIITQGVGLLLDIIEALFTLFLSVIALILTYFTQLTGFVAALVNGFNTAQPVPIPGIPTCNLDPRQSGFCIILYALEHTVFADEGIVFIPLLISIGSILFINWAIHYIREKLAEIGYRM
jgi:PKD repeat protein